MALRLQETTHASCLHRIIILFTMMETFEKVKSLTYETDPEQAVKVVVASSRYVNFGVLFEHDIDLIIALCFRCREQSCEAASVWHGS